VAGRFIHATAAFRRLDKLAIKMSYSSESPKNNRNDSADISGSMIRKDEFVTCGGVRLKEVDFRTMESRQVSGLYFAGECLDIDGITGGFNFQACWTGGRIAGLAMADKHIA
jgi:predicted flavoprotein YhiN